MQIQKYKIEDKTDKTVDISYSQNTFSYSIKRAHNISLHIAEGPRTLKATSMDFTRGPRTTHNSTSCQLEIQYNSIYQLYKIYYIKLQFYLVASIKESHS